MAASQKIVVTTRIRTKTPKSSSSSSNSYKRSNTSGHKGKSRCPTCGKYR